MKQLARIAGLATVVALFLVGCGDDSTAASGDSSASNKPTEYASLEEAGACAPSRYGETVYVIGEEAFYFCGGNAWVSIGDGNNGASSANDRATESSDAGISSSQQSWLAISHKPIIQWWWPSHDSVTINDTIKFVVYAADANGIDDILGYDWDFGDGTFLHKTDSSSVKHAYSRPGDYSVSIKLTDSSGDTAMGKTAIAVIVGEPVVDAGKAVTCYSTLPCQFHGTAEDKNKGSKAGAGKIVRYEWDWNGDGIIDERKTDNNFAHTWPDSVASAIYKAKFCATDDDDNRVCDTTTIDLWAKHGSFVDERDGQSYKYAVIGTQVWMAENLNVGTYVKSNVEQGDVLMVDAPEMIQKYCYWDDSLRCNKQDDWSDYGAYYQWHTAMGGTRGLLEYTSQPKEPNRGICPLGWHIPSRLEWVALDLYIIRSNEGSENNSGKSLIANAGDRCGRDVYGFDGIISDYGVFNYAQRSHENYWRRKQDYSSSYMRTEWWSSTVTNDDVYTALGELGKMYARRLGCDEPSTNYTPTNFTEVEAVSASGLHVRCIKDTE